MINDQLMSIQLTMLNNSMINYQLSIIIDQLIESTEQFTIVQCLFKFIIYH